MVEMYSIAIIALLSAMSPGPDFVVLTKYALCETRTKAFYCTFGIALGILVHTSYCVLGLALIISQSIFLFNVIKLAGAAYLIYLGVQGLRQAGKEVKLPKGAINSSKTRFEAFKEGFFINVLNPKCSLFMLSVFTFVVSPNTSHTLQALYGVEIAFIAFCWFCFLASVISIAPIKRRFAHVQQVISRLTGAVLILLGLKIALDRN